MRLIYEVYLPPDNTSRTLNVLVNGAGYGIQLHNTESKVTLKPVNQGDDVTLSIEGCDNVVSFTANPISYNLEGFSVILSPSSTVEEVPAPPPPPAIEEIAPPNIVNGDAVVTSVASPEPEIPPSSNIFNLL